MSYHFQFVATATAQALTMLEAKEVDREALRRLLTNLHAFARDQANRVRKQTTKRN